MAEDKNQYGEPLKGLGTKEGRLRELESQGYDVSYEVPSGTTYRQEQQRQMLQTSPIQGIGFAGVGDSRYDERITSATQLDDLNNTRGELQPWYSQLANGVSKGVILAGTTFLDGTLGLAVGIPTAIAEGKFSGLWDNDFSKAMKAVNDYAETELLPNYYTNQEQEQPFYKNIFTANFIGDKFLKNLGFTVGAFYGGGLWTKPLQIGKVAETIATVARSSKAPALVSSAVGSTIAAVNESRIEALNNSTDWEKLQTTKLDDNHAQRLNFIIEQFGDSDVAYELIGDANKDYEENLIKIQEDKAKMGNADMLANIPLLMASNVIQFGKLYAGGYKTARKTTGIVKKAANEYGRSSGKAFTIGRALLNPMSEGIEEISQRTVSTISGDYYEDKLNNFYANKINPDAEQQTVSWLKSFGQGINETVNDNSAWEEFFIGTLTGALGMPSFGRSNTRRAWIGKNKNVGLSGGIMGELREQGEQAQREQVIVDYMNQRAQSPEFRNYYQGLIRHNKLQNDMNNAVEVDDEFEFKNAEHSQLVNDVMMFDNAGKLSDLIEMIEGSFDTSDANLQSIIDNTTSTIKNDEGKDITVGPFVDGNGNPLHSTPEGKKEMIDKLTRAKDDILSKVSEYTKSKDAIDIATGQRLSDDQLTELTWLKTQINDWDKRGNEIAKNSKQFLSKISGQLGKYEAIATQKRILEGSKHADITEEYTKLEKEEKDLRDTQTFLQQLIQMDDAVLSTVISSPEIKNILEKGSVAGTMDETLTVDESDQFLKGLNDLKRIEDAKTKYNKRLKSYLENPNMLADDIIRTEQAVIDQQAKDIADNMTNITNVKSLREALNNVDINFLPKILNHLNNSEDSNIREVVKQYNELGEAQTLLNGIFRERPNNSVEQSIVNIATDAFENANSLQEAESIIAQAIMSEDVPRDVKQALEEVMDKYSSLKKSVNADKEDTNIPKKKRSSKKATTGGALSKLSDEANKLDAGLEEEETGRVKEKAETPEENAEIIQPTTQTPSIQVPAFAEGGTESNSNAENNASPTVTESESSPSLRSWATETRFNFNDLQKRDTRKMTKYNSPISDALEVLGAYSFVDNGKLGKLFHKNPNIKIHYILSDDPILKDRVLLGIQVTQDVLNTVKTVENPITVNNVQYQIIGTLGYNSKNESSRVNYNNIKSAMADEAEGSTGKYFVSNKFFNNIKHIYSGRMVKSSNTEDVSNKPVNREFLQRNNVELHLGFYYKENDFRTPTLDQTTELIEPLNSNNNNPREGSVWLMTQEADGVWYAKAIQIKRFTNSEYPILENLNSPLLKKITEQLRVFSDPNKTETQRLEARDIIEDILYFPKNDKSKSEHTLLYKEIKDDSGKIIDVVVSIKDIANNIAEGQNVDNKAFAILQLLQDESLNLRFQISPSQMTDKTTVNDILDSNIITTDLLQPLNVNASFDLYLNDIDNGEPVKPTMEAATVGHVGRKGINSSLTRTTIYSGGFKYYIYENGEVVNAQENPVTDSNKLSEIDLSLKISQGTINPIEGSKLFIGYYKDGTEFGMIGKRILKGEDLNKQKNDILMKKKKQDKKELVDTVMDTLEDPDDSMFANAPMINQLQPVAETETDELPDDAFENAPMINSIAVEPEQRNTIEKVIEKVIKNTQTTTSTSTEKTPLITEDSINLKPTLASNEAANLNQFLRKKTNKQLKEQLFEKLNVNNIPDALSKINELPNLPNIETLTTMEQFESFIKTVLECR